MNYESTCLAHGPHNTLKSREYYKTKLQNQEIKLVSCLVAFFLFVFSIIVRLCLFSKSLKENMRKSRKK